MLTEAQKQTLAAAIRASAEPTVVAALAIRNDVALTDWYNGASAFIVWRTNVPADEYRKAMVWTEVDALTAGKARIWEWVTANMTTAIDASNVNVRQGIQDAFSGTAPNTLTALTALAKRAATNAEALFATGTGTNGSPGALVVEGTVSLTELSQALNRY